MKIQILVVGKVKESFFRQGIEEYKKRLSSYVKLDIQSVKEEKAPQSLSRAEEEQVKEKEGKALLRRVDEKDEVILLDIQGEHMDSMKFSKILKNYGITGTKNLIFIIGGSLGVSNEVRNRANRRISFSKMTFPHQLMQIILLEQIYRGYRIMENHPYHK